MFVGEYLHRIDNKGRLILPSAYREELEQRFEDKFHVTVGVDECLKVYPDSEWKKAVEQLGTLPQADAKTRYVVRMVVANASPTTIDKQGRIFIPGTLREKVGIAKDVFVIGMMDTVEVWAKEKWETYRKAFDKQPLEKYHQELFDKGIFKK